MFGDNNPGGKLTITFPRSVGQLPDYYNFDPSKTDKYADGDSKPLFPFGFGLSYTTFSYSGLTVLPVAAGSADDITVNVQVTNTGGVDGDEVAQLYLSHDFSSVEVPAKALKGFRRIHLKPGESQTVTFRLQQSELALWNSNRKWVVEPGGYSVTVGGSSEAKLSAKFTIPDNAKTAQAGAISQDR